MVSFRRDDNELFFKSIISIYELVTTEVQNCSQLPEDCSPLSYNLWVIVNITFSFLIKNIMYSKVNKMIKVKYKIQNNKSKSMYLCK